MQIIQNDKPQIQQQLKNSLKEVGSSVKNAKDFAATLQGLTVSLSLSDSENPLLEKLELSLVDELALVPKNPKEQNENFGVAILEVLKDPIEPLEYYGESNLSGSSNVLIVVIGDSCSFSRNENQEPLEQIAPKEQLERQTLNLLNSNKADELLISKGQEVAFPQKEDSNPSNLFLSQTPIPLNVTHQGSLKSSNQGENQTLDLSNGENSNIGKQINVSTMAEQQPQKEEDTKENNSNNLSRPLINREVNSSFTNPGSQTFQKHFESSGESRVNHEQELPVKELPQFILKQINDKIKFNHVTGSTEINLKLKPEELGKMTLQLLAQDGQVSVKILTENVRAREMIEQNLIQLRQTFVNQGIKCSSIEVEVSTDSSFNQFMGHPNNPFNQSRNNSKGKDTFSSNKKKELQLDSYNRGDNSISPIRNIYEGLELFA